MDLTEFLEARWDEEACVAEAAIPGPWRWNPQKAWRKPGTSWWEEAVFAGPAGDAALCIAGTGEMDDPQSMADAVHIAYWDPARVLADIAVKRAILAIHAPFYEYSDVEKKYPLCSRREDGVQRLVAFPCETTLALVQIYRSHPDFDQAWSVPT